MIKDFSNFFPHKDSTYINLNNGTLGLCPKNVLEAQVQAILNFEKNTSFSLGNSWEIFWNIHQQLGAFFNSEPENFFLRPNVTLVLNEFILGLNLNAEDVVVTNDLEYGAINNILKHLSRTKKVHYHELKFSEFLEKSELTDSDLIDFFVESLPLKTKMVLISHVFTGNGLIFPIEKLAQKLKEKNIFLIVDGAHGPGLLDLNFKDFFPSVGFYAGNLHKWMMGPKGTAFGWTHPDFQKYLTPTFGSWTTETETPPIFTKFYPKDHFVRKFLWSHSQGFSSFYALIEMFSFWNAQGAKVIAHEIQSRMNFLRNELLKSGLKEELSSSPNLNRAFVCYSADQISLAGIDGLILKKDSSPLALQIGLPHLPGKKLIRLTPHIHNTSEELSKTVKILST